MSAKLSAKLYGWNERIDELISKIGAANPPAATPAPTAVNPIAFFLLLLLFLSACLVSVSVLTLTIELSCS